MDAATISALAASGAALVAATVAGIQFWVGRRQSEAAFVSAKATLMNAENAGRHKVAEFRQSWIGNVIDALTEYQAIILTYPKGHAPEPGTDAKLASLRTRLELLLNPEEKDTIALLRAMDELKSAIKADDREARADAVVGIARPLLKREWVRLKGELTAEPTR